MTVLPRGDTARAGDTPDPDGPNPPAPPGGGKADEPVTVVVADDQSAVREGLVLLLGTLPGITVVGEAVTGAGVG